MRHGELRDMRPYHFLNSTHDIGYPILLGRVGYGGCMVSFHWSTSIGVGGGHVEG